MFYRFLNDTGSMFIAQTLLMDGPMDAQKYNRPSVTFNGDLEERRRIRKIFETLDGRLPRKQGSDRRETLRKRVSDDPHQFKFW